MSSTQPKAELRDQPARVMDLPPTATVIAGGAPQYTSIVGEPHQTTSTHFADDLSHHRHSSHRSEKRDDSSLRTRSHADGEKKTEIKVDIKTKGRDDNKDKERRKSLDRKDSKDGKDKEWKSPTEGQKTPKDFNFKFDMHTDEAGKKEVDAKFHFEGKRDHLDDDKDDKESKDSKDKKDGDGEGKQKTIGKLAEVIGGKMQEKAKNKEREPEILEPRNATIHAGGMGGKIKQKVKTKIGDALQNAATEMLVHKPGDMPRDLNASIKHHMEQANRLEREAFVEEQMSHDQNLRRAERKEASKRADDAKYRAKVEIATAEAEKHVLESH